MIKVHVLIVTFNRLDNLKICLQSLAEQTVKIESIHVVDNASTDGTDEFMANSSAPDIHYYRLNQNTGGAGGFAYGFELLKPHDFDWLWIMDDDVKPKSDCLQKLLGVSGNFDVRQPVRYYDDGTFVVSEAREFNLTNPFRSLKKGMIRSWPKENMPIAAFPFEGPLISNRAFNSTDGPIASFFILYDDTEYAVRINKLGYRALLVKDALMVRQIKPIRAKQLDWKFDYTFINGNRVDSLHGNYFVARLRPILRAMRFTITGLIYLRPWPQILKPFSLLFSKNAH